MSSFQCISLAEISLSPTNAAAQSSNLPLMYAVRGLHYLVEKGEIVAVTSDHNFCFFKMYVSVPITVIIPVTVFLPLSLSALYFMCANVCVSVSDNVCACVCVCV